LTATLTERRPIVIETLRETQMPNLKSEIGFVDRRIACNYRL
jgi:hypothetical protein